MGLAVLAAVGLPQGVDAVVAAVDVEHAVAGVQGQGLLRDLHGDQRGQGVLQDIHVVDAAAPQQQRVIVPLLAPQEGVAVDAAAEAIPENELIGLLGIFPGTGPVEHDAAAAA